MISGIEEEEEDKPKKKLRRRPEEKEKLPEEDKKDSEESEFRINLYDDKKDKKERNSIQKNLLKFLKI